MNLYPFERPGRPGEFINLRRIDASQMFTTLSQIAPAEIYSELRKTIFGETEVENPNHPKSVAEVERVQREANEVLVRYYLTQGIDLELTDRMNAEIDEKIAEFRAITGDAEWKPASRKLFYIEKVFCTELDSLGDMVAAIHNLTFVRREEATAFAELFRTHSKWAEYLAQFATGS